METGVVSIITNPSMVVTPLPQFTPMDLHSTPMHNRWVEGEALIL